MSNLTSGFVIDVEATCWETREEQGVRLNEVIEIGVAELEFQTGKILQRASIAVKPRFSTISPFCEQLTGWSQEIIDAEGLDIEDALTEFNKLFSPTANHIWFSCGEYDRQMLSSAGSKGLGRLYNIEAHRNPFDFMRSHFNVKTLFALKRKFKREVGMVKMLQLIGEKVEGRHHNGADDALNIAKLVNYVLR